MAKIFLVNEQEGDNKGNIYLEGNDVELVQLIMTAMDASKEFRHVVQSSIRAYQIAKAKGVSMAIDPQRVTDDEAEQLFEEAQKGNLK